MKYGFSVVTLIVFTSANPPLRADHATGAPVNPVAIF